MKKIGLVGGIGPASTVDYYLGLIERYRAQFGDDRYPEIVIDSIDMHEMIDAFGQNDYDKVAEMLLNSVENLKAAGATLAAITSNTPHIVWDKVLDKFSLPCYSIVEAAVEAAKQNAFQRVLIFGTEFTMSSGLYDKAFDKAGIHPVVLSKEDQLAIGHIIYPNLENGIIIPADKEKMIAIAEKYIQTENADALLLGCTEIPLMIKAGDVSVPIIDTTQIHIDKIYAEYISMI